MRFLVGLVCLAGCCLAGETAILAGGGRIRVERHEIDGARVRLFNGSGFIEMDAALVRQFEPDDSAVAEPGASKEPAPPPATAAPVQPKTPGELADAAADKYGVPRWLVRGVMAAESDFQTRAVSPKGAIGLMQLMPDTARELGADPHDPAQNVDAGTRYLRDLLVRYDGLLWRSVAAYNAGPGAVDKYHDVPPYRETVRYVQKIDQAYRKARDGN